MINLSDLQAFLFAAEAGSFSAAGRKMHLSQPAISQKIDSLEKRFGSKLFMRQGRSVRLTDAGQTLLPIARELLTATHRLEEIMASLQGELIGEMNLGCSTAAGKYLLPGLIARFRCQFPKVRINVLVSSRDTVMNQLVSGELTFGISSKQIEHRELEYQDFFTDEIILIVSANHPWANYRLIYPSDLLEEPLILREEASGTYEVLMKCLQSHDISPDMLKIGMVLGNAEAIVMAVGEGIGVAFISRVAAERDIELGRVVEVQVEGMRMHRNIYMARNLRIPGTRAQAAWWEFVRDSKKQLSAALPQIT